MRGQNQKKNAARPQQGRIEKRIGSEDEQQDSQAQ